MEDDGSARELNEGLDVVENWNSASGFDFFGKGDEIANSGTKVSFYWDSCGGVTAPWRARLRDAVRSITKSAKARTFGESWRLDCQTRESEPKGIMKDVRTGISLPF